MGGVLRCFIYNHQSCVAKLFVEGVEMLPPLPEYFVSMARDRPSIVVLNGLRLVDDHGAGLRMLGMGIVTDGRLLISGGNGIAQGIRGGIARNGARERERESGEAYASYTVAI